MLDASGYAYILRTQKNDQKMFELAQLLGHRKLKKELPER